MWARICEWILAVWLMAGGWLFEGATEAAPSWPHDMAVGMGIILVSALSLRRGLNRLHLLVIPAALWLLGIGFTTSTTPPPALYQNYIATGLVLLMFAIVPNRASHPPPLWGDAYAQNSESE